MAQFQDPGYSSILVKNDTSESEVFLFVYPRGRWFPVYWISYKSQTIQAGKRYLYRSAKNFKYEVRLKSRTDKRRIIVPPTMWTHNKRLLITDEGSVIEDDLSKYPWEHQMCVRWNNMREETSEKHGCNLYAILGLDMREVRKESLEEQDRIIRQAFRRRMFDCHPDRNPMQDNHLCQEITYAYSILGHHEKRAQYNDLADYNSGWLSKSKWKAIFKPEAHGKSEKLRRIGLLLLSSLSVVGGVVLSFMTAGLAAPAVIGWNVVVGALIGGGIQSAQRTVSYDSIANGVSMKKFLQSYAFGAGFGAVAGVATAGIASAMVGVGSSAVSVAELSVLELLQNGAATGSVNGALALLASDADQAFVDGKKVTWKEVACHAILGGLTGAAAGAGGGLLTKGIHVKASAVTVEGEVVEQGFNKFVTKYAVRHAPTIGKIAEGAKRKTLNAGIDVIEESLKNEPEAYSPDTRENVPEKPNEKDTNLEEAIFKLYDERRHRQHLLGPVIVENSKEEQEAHSPETRDNFTEKPNYEDINFKGAIFKLYDEQRVHFDPEEYKKEKIRYVCKKEWSSRMIVEYADATKSWKRSVVEGSGSTVEIPEKATNILVGFQAWRGCMWCDVKKYDRISKRWCERTEPHLFMFDNPLSCTFTLDGGRFYEHVSRVTNEKYDEVNI